MDILLTLTKHCIETETKKAYERLIKQYFNKNTSNKDKNRIESTLEKLKFFLEHADFPKMRSAYPELGGASDLSVSLHIPENVQKAILTFNGRSVPPEWKK